MNKTMPTGLLLQPLIKHSSSGVGPHKPSAYASICRCTESPRCRRVWNSRRDARGWYDNPQLAAVLNSPPLSASYLPLIKHLRSLLTKKQKKSYTISVGKLNPAKLANFLEIECFVLVACPENSMIDIKVCPCPFRVVYERNRLTLTQTKGFFATHSDAV